MSEVSQETMMFKREPIEELVKNYLQQINK